MHSRTLLALSGALALLVQPQLAAAQQACLAEDEVSAMVVYAVPSMVRSVQMACGAQLSQQGWLAREGGAFSARYASLQNNVWPTAKAGLLKMIDDGSMEAEAAQTLSAIANLPDESVRPLVDALMVQEVSARIPAKDCGSIERVMEAIAPVEPQVAGTLIATLATLIADEQPIICPAPPR